MENLIVLTTERYGLKPQGKSAPMASLKRSINSNHGETSQFTSYDSSRSARNKGFNIGSEFNGGGFDDFAVFDELTKFSFKRSGKSWNQNMSNDLGKNEASFDELIFGFSQPSNRTPTLNLIDDDPFEVLPSTLVHPSSVDVLAEFSMDSLQDSETADIYRESEDVEEKKQEFCIDDLESFLNPGHRSCATTETSCKQHFGTPKERYNNYLLSIRKPATPAHVRDDFFGTEVLDDLSPLFGGDSFLGEFKEIMGESEERRTARWEREQRIKKQMDKAVSDMKNRDLQIQIEQEERSRISETLDAEIKLWAAGKEGNVRALLSSLHLILWPGCGWEAISLTDLITYEAVKKVYKKANLYVHPDKVHQRGAQQKYIAEKVFNILKEAWNKFNNEELS